MATDGLVAFATGGLAAFATGAVARATVVMVAAAVAAVALRSPAARHRAWLFGLAGAVAVPLGMAAGPAWRVLPAATVPRTADVSPPAAVTPVAEPRPDQGRPPVPEVRTLAPTPGGPAVAAAARPAVQPRARRPAARPVAAPPPPPPLAGPAVKPVRPAAAPHRWPWQAWLWAAWAVGVAVVLGRAAAGGVALVALGRRAAPVGDPPTLAVARQVAARLGLAICERNRVPSAPPPVSRGTGAELTTDGRPVGRGAASGPGRSGPARLRSVRLLQRPAAMPMTWGVLRPRVLLPTESADWSAGRLRSVLLHELGHVRRLDCAAEWVARVATAAYWFHPLAWAAAAGLRREREGACDDLVLADGAASPPAYAEHLLRVVAAARLPAAAAFAAVPMARPGELERRVRMILDPRDRRAGLNRTTATILAAAAAAVIVPLATVHRRPTPVPGRPVAVVARAAAGEAVRVVDEQGQPVAGATVRAAAEPHTQFVETWDARPVKPQAAGDDGGVAVRVAAGRRVNAAAVAPGYAVSVVTGVVAPATVTLTSGQPIAGGVRRLDGSPVAGATVTAEPVYAPLLFVPEATVTARTGDDGKFSIDHAAAGTYRLTLAGAADLTAAPVTVAVPVERPPAAAELTATPAASVRGRFVNDRPDGPVAGQTVSVRLRWPAPARWTVRTDDRGAFAVTNLPTDAVGEIGFPDVGTDMAVASWPTAPAGVRVDPSTVHLGDLSAGVHDGLTVRVSSPATLAVDVVDPDGKPFGKADVAVGPELRVYHTDDAGHAEVEVPPGTPLTVRAKAADRTGWPAGASEPFTAEAGGTVARRVVAVRAGDDRPFDRQITGVVVDAAGHSVAKAKVVMDNRDLMDLTQRPRKAGAKQPAARDGWFGPADVETDADGRFTFDQLAAGRTTLWAADADRAAFGEVDGVEPNGPDVTITLKPGTAKGATFAGVITDDKGGPIRQADVYLYGGQVSQPELLGQAKTDAAGAFAVRPMLAPVFDVVPVLRLIGRDGGGRVAWRAVQRCGGERLDLQLLPDTTAAGRVVDEAGHPVGGARVYVVAGESPDVGLIQFRGPIAAVAPDARTAADGTYTVHGLPPGGRVTVWARAAGYLPASSAGVQFDDPRGPSSDPPGVAPHVVLSPARFDPAPVRPGLTLPDLILRSGSTLDGTVTTDGGDLSPAGAAVAFDGYWGDPDNVVATADGQGRFRIVGVPESSASRASTLIVTLAGDTRADGWRQLPNVIYPGDHLTGLTVTARPVDRAAEYAAWAARPGKAAASRFRAAVVDAAADESLTGRQRGERLTIWDGAATAAPAYQPPAGSAIINAYVPPVAADPADGSVYANQGGSLSKFAADGHLLWRHEKTPTEGLAVDPDGGDLWAIDARDYVGNGVVAVYDRDGNRLGEHDVGGVDAIAYDAHDRGFWVVGKRMARLDRDGRVAARGPLTVPYYADHIAVDPADGSAWVGEYTHPAYAGDVERLWTLAADGRVRRLTDDDGRQPLAVDAARGVAWVTVGVGGVGRMSTATGKPVGDPVPIAGRTLAVEPDTGCAWVGTLAGVWRLDPDGRPVAFHPTVGYARQVTLIGGGGR